MSSRLLTYLFLLPDLRRPILIIGPCGAFLAQGLRTMGKPAYWLRPSSPAPAEDTEDRVALPTSPGLLADIGSLPFGPSTLDAVILLEDPSGAVRRPLRPDMRRAFLLQMDEILSESGVLLIGVGPMGPVTGSPIDTAPAPPWQHSVRKAVLSVHRVPRIFRLVSAWKNLLRERDSLGWEEFRFFPSLMRPSLLLSQHGQISRGLPTALTAILGKEAPVYLEVLATRLLPSLWFSASVLRVARYR